MYVSEILKAKGSNVVTIPQTAGISEAAVMLRDYKFGALVAVDEAGGIAGIMSERDIVRVVGDMGTKGLVLRVQDIMTRHLRTCQSSDSLDFLMQLMTSHRIRHVPVVDAGKVKGLVSQTDVIKYALDEQDSQVQVQKNLNLARN